MFSNLVASQASNKPQKTNGKKPVRLESRELHININSRIPLTRLLAETKLRIEEEKLSREQRHKKKSSCVVQ
jgi:hypothetical protein